jgi:hypothetical protein
LIEHSKFGSQLVETDHTLDELVDLAIRTEYWGLTYYVPQSPGPTKDGQGKADG